MEINYPALKTQTTHFFGVNISATADQSGLLFKTAHWRFCCGNCVVANTTSTKMSGAYVVHHYREKIRIMIRL